MAEDFDDLMCRYVGTRSHDLKGCLVAAFKSRDHYLSLLDESLGSPIPNDEIRNCEVLADAGLFREEIKLNRDGRNRYKLFYLTEKGQQIAEQIIAEGFNGSIPESVPVI